MFIIDRRVCVRMSSLTGGHSHSSQAASSTANAADRSPPAGTEKETNRRRAANEGRLTERDAEVAEGAAGDGHVDGELGVAEGGEQRAEAGNGVGHDEAGPRVDAGGAARGHEHAGAHHAAEPEPHQVPSGCTHGRVPVAAGAAAGARQSDDRDGGGIVAAIGRSRWRRGHGCA